MAHTSSLASADFAPWAIRIAEQAPPLTPEQITRIRAVLAPAIAACAAVPQAVAA